MVCNAAKQSSNPYTITRVKDSSLYQTWQSLNGDLSVDTMFCLDVLTAKSIVQTSALPGAKAVDTFADGKVEVAEFEIGENTPVTNQTVVEADRYASVTFAAILREDDIIIPDGDTVIQAGDRLVVIGSLPGVSRFAEAMSSQSTLDSNDNVVIVGGDMLGYRIAQHFEARGWTPRIVERDPEQATRLSAQRQGPSISEADVTNIGGFTLDFFVDADLVVGAVDDDTNYLLAQLAREHNVDRTAVVVDDPAIVELFEESGFDVVVHPEDCIIGDILQAIYGRDSESVGTLEHDDAEVLEVILDEGSALTGQTLSNAADHLSANFVIGAIIREGQLQIPRGNKIIQTGDRVIVFVDAEIASDVSTAI